MTDHSEVSQEEVDAVDLARLFRARRLFGWPVKTLDALAALRDRATDRKITVDEWRQEAADLRREAPAPPDGHEVAAAQAASREAWWAEFERDELDGPGSRLLKRLGELEGPPSDDDLWRDLADYRARSRTAPQDHRQTWAARADSAAMMVTRDGATHDLTSGLPWTLLGRYRWVDFQRAGLVPAPLGLARERAEQDVDAGAAGDDVVRERRRLLTGRSERERHSMAAASAEMQLHFLTGLASALVEEAGSQSKARRQLAKEFDAVWSSEAMTRFLLEQTASGWPSRFARSRRPT